MLHATVSSSLDFGFQNLKVFTLYRHDGHLGYMAITIFINLCPHFPKRLHI